MVCVAEQRRTGDDVSFSTHLHKLKIKIITMTMIGMLELADHPDQIVCKSATAPLCCSCTAVKVIVENSAGSLSALHKTKYH